MTTEFLTEQDILKLNANNIYTEGDLRIAKSMDFIHDSIVNQTENPKCLRSFFEERYLPFFKGEVELDHNNNYIQEWRTIAGSYGNRVDVMNADGTLAYVVPPLIDTERFSRNEKGHSDLSRRTYDFFNRKGRANQISQDQFFKEINDTVTTDEDNELMRNDWYKLFSIAEGREIEEKPEEISTPSVSATNVKYNF